MPPPPPSVPCSAPPLARRRAREPEGLYVHIPFCVRKCSYCDFVSGPAATARRLRYLEALAREAEGLPADFRARTVFVGGGTPSMLLPSEIDRLGAILRPFLDDTTVEVSFEGNPGTLSRERLERFAAAGATRVSMGAQTFDPEGLRRLGRIHDGRDVERAAKEVQRLGLQLNIDLIFGYPGQTLASLEHDLERMLAIGPGHISAYCLIYEPGTPLFEARAQGSLQTVPDAAQERMAERVQERLGAAGYGWYEVSNHALPGRECEHNLLYWRNEAYHALGLAATSYVDGVRATRVADLEDYCARLAAGRPVIARRERLGEREEAAETLMLALRMRRGFTRSWFRERTGMALSNLLEDRLQPLVEQGLLWDDGERVAVAPAGVFLSDSLTTALWPDTLEFPAEEES